MRWLAWLAFYACRELEMQPVCFLTLQYDMHRCILQPCAKCTFARAPVLSASLWIFFFAKNRKTHYVDKYLSVWIASSWRGMGGSLMYPVCLVGKRLPWCCTVSCESPRWSACTAHRTSRSGTGTRWPFSQLWWIPKSPSCSSSLLGCQSRSRRGTFS